MMDKTFLQVACLFLGAIGVMSGHIGLAVFMFIMFFLML